MNTYDWIQIIFYIGMLVVLTPPLGAFMAKVFEGEKHLFSAPLGWMERGVYRFSGINPQESMNWKGYTWALILFHGIGFAVVFLLQIFQSHLPLNPQALPNTSWHLAFNTAASFITNTNWQSYAGETTMSYFTQMLGLTVQNFVSAAVGISVMIALIRGIRASSAKATEAKLGNFWADLTRATIYVLLPFSIILALALVGQGVVQTFTSYVTAHTVAGVDQVIPLGPAASQIAIKMLGTNGGGFFNTNSAHPFENPTPFSNWLEMFSILIIPAALVYTYGVMIKAKRQALVIYLAMMILFVGALGVSIYGEYTNNPIFSQATLMEGKETRFGVINSLIWSNATTVASNGSVNAMHASLSPIAGGVALFNMMLGEIVFGGVGSGFYGMMAFVLLTVFLAGLMVGRTPEYLGKKVHTREIVLLILTILIPSGYILLASGMACILPEGLSSLLNKGPHGFTEIIYAFTSATQNNGSAFAGLNANVPFYNILLGIGNLMGRFGVIIPIMAVAGSFSQKNISPPSEGTFKTDNALFLVLLIAVILIVGALSHLPSLALGPIAEHFLMLKGVTF